MRRQPRSVPVIEGPVDAVIRPPGSKSETIRAIAAASMAEGRSHLYSPLDAEDPSAMVAAVRAMGTAIEDRSDPWVVDGLGEPRHGDLVLDANESGLSARILLAMAASSPNSIRIEGKGRLPERPMSGLIDALRSQGVVVEGERVPIDVTGQGRLWGGHLVVDCTDSSQFASALMLVAPMMENPCQLEITGLTGSAGYLEGTVSVMTRFGASAVKTVTGYEIDNTGYRPSDVVIEPDASSATYPMAIAAITGGRVTVEGLGADSWQPDVSIADVFEEMGCLVERGRNRLVVDARSRELIGLEVDMSHAPDGALAVAVVACFASSPTTLRGLGSLRPKESDRLAALASEIGRVGGAIKVGGDSLVIEPMTLQGAVIDPHGDHRIAMALACAGSRVPGISVADPDVVNKTWPKFWDMFDQLSR
ncbi:MAG TPA: 3-phosphoshikimate 1-carboxyvinyltransferase [Acidimicrobiia bacterium]|nr:3-phosphoshikimate 1-carboxyvinyltransferase [Acidimicrobiia bacterium]